MEVIFKILRFIPDKNKQYFQEYKIPFEEGMTVLDGLIYIKDNLDPTLSFRYSCRMGICGSCAMMINRKFDLACHTQILKVSKTKIELKPLPNYQLIKDLVVDLTSIFQKHTTVKPYLIRENIEEQENPICEFHQQQEELEKYLQFSYCIKCGICAAVCPTSITDKLFLSPFVLAQTYRYCVDTRDEGLIERLNKIDTLHGLWGCHFAGSCSYACPKGVDPALAIQLLKRTITKKIW